MIVLKYFFKKMDEFGPLMDEQKQKEQQAAEQEQYAFMEEEEEEEEVSLTRSLILALSVCYHARLSNRKDYEEGVAREFVAPLNLPGGVQQFRDEIRW